MFVVDVKFHTASAARRRAVASTEQAGGQLPRVASSHGMICPFNPPQIADRRERAMAVNITRSLAQLAPNDSVLGVRRQQKPNLDCRECLVAPNADILNRLLYSRSGGGNIPIERRGGNAEAMRDLNNADVGIGQHGCGAGVGKFPRSLSSYRKDIEIDRKRLPALEGHSTRYKAIEDKTNMEFRHPQMLAKDGKPCRFMFYRRERRSGRI